MSGNFDTLETRTELDRSGAADASAERSFELKSVVVRYEDAPDRRTVYPPERSSTERLTTWLSADEDAFRPLEEMR